MQHTILAEIFVDGDWEAVPTYNRDEVVITRGRQDQLTMVSPSQCNLTINNRSGTYSPRNANSPLYGKIGPNTRLRVSIDGDVRFVGEVQSWPQRWTKGATDVWVPITAYGIMQRLGMPGQKVLARSAMRRFYANVSPQPLAYWPLESGDERPVTEFGSGLDGGANLRVAVSTLFGVTRPFSAASGVTPGPPGASGATDTHAGGYLRGPIRRVSSATTARCEMAMLADGFESTFPILIRLRVPGTTYIGVACSDLGPGHRLGVIWANQTLSGDNYTTDPFSLQDNQYHFVQLDASSSGGGADTAYVLRVDGVVIKSGTATGLTWLPPTEVDVNGLAVDVDRVAHVAAWSGTSLPTAADSYDAFTGHAGEEAHTRIERICAEEGIDITITGSASERLGAQLAQSPLELMYDAAETGGGILYEPRDAFGLAYRCLHTLENQPPKLALTYGSKEIGAALDPVEDLDLTQNDVTVTRRGGMSARSIQETGPRNVQESVDDPEGVGRFPVEYELSLYEDGQAAQHASWRRHLGRADLCQHEAAHAVVALHFGLDIHHASVPDGPGEGETLTRDAGDPWINALVSAAGMAVRALSGTGFLMFYPSDHDLRAVCDLVGADRLMEAITAARAILLEHEAELSAVTAALLERGSLTGAEITEVLAPVTEPAAS